MPNFVIEREIVGAGKLPKQELQAISQKSCNVLAGMGRDKIYCIYVVPDEAMVKTHAQKGAFRPTGFHA